MKKCIYLLFVATAVQAMAPSTPHLISFFMIPCAQNPACAKKFPQESLKNLNFSQEVLRGHLTSPLVQGIYVTYLGYLTYSDYNGQVTLPNRESENNLTVVVTEQVYPVIFRGNTVHHFEIPEHVDFHIFQYTLAQDPDHKQWHWTVKQLPAKSRQLPEHALIILAKPQDIEIMPGTFVAHEAPNFILPDIYVHTGANSPVPTLKFLKINHFFEPLVIEKRAQEQAYLQMPRS